MKRTYKQTNDANKKPKIEGKFVFHNITHQVSTDLPPLSLVLRQLTGSPINKEYIINLITRNMGMFRHAIPTLAKMTTDVIPYQLQYHDIPRSGWAQLYHHMLHRDRIGIISRCCIRDHGDLKQLEIVCKMMSRSQDTENIVSKIDGAYLHQEITNAFIEKISDSRALSTILPGDGPTLAVCVKHFFEQKPLYEFWEIANRCIRDIPAMCLIMETDFGDQCAKWRSNTLEELRTYNQRCQQMVKDAQFLQNQRVPTRLIGGTTFRSYGWVLLGLMGETHMNGDVQSQPSLFENRQPRDHEFKFITPRKLYYPERPWISQAPKFGFYKNSQNFAFVNMREVPRLRLIVTELEKRLPQAIASVILYLLN
jgi:hypothetical protein